MRIKDVREIFYHAGPHVSCAEDDAILDSLDGLRNLTQNPELVSRKAGLRTLNIVQLEAEFLHQAVVNQRCRWCRQLLS